MGDPMRRWNLILLLGYAAFVLCFPAQAQPVTKVWRIGYLSGSTWSPNTVGQFVAGLRELGYVEGKNISIDFRIADGQVERLPAMARDLEGFRRA